MIISRTPFRISFFGGGTDYPIWYRQNGGVVLASTIDKYVYITCRVLPPFFDHKSRVVWSKIETVTKHADIEHPVVRAALALLEVNHGIEIHYNGDLPARSGVGSSSAFTVGILNSLYALKGQYTKKADLARQAIYLEQTMLNEHVGVQDQIETTFGGFNRIEILRNGTFQVEPVILPAETLQALNNNLLLFYTGIPRGSSNIAKMMVESIPHRQRELSSMQKMVDVAVDFLAKGALDDFGRLLDETWQLKRSLSKHVAPNFINEIYARARAAGALGGKVLGAGGGGFMLFYVRKDERVTLLKALEDLLVVPFEFETGGSQIIFYDPDRYSRTVMASHTFRRWHGEDAKTKPEPATST